MLFSKSWDYVFFISGDMDGLGFFLDTDWALALCICLKTLEK